MTVPDPYTPKTRRLPGAPGPVHYFLACLSFIPFLGLPLAVGSIIFGSLKMDRGGGKLLAMGVGGVLATLLTAYFGASFGFKKLIESDAVRSGMREASQETLDSLALSIEAYKTKVGEYPEDLGDLDTDSARAGLDPLHILTHGTVDPIHYGYRSDGETYSVFSAGWDKLEGTQDDFYPRDSIVALCKGFRKPEAGAAVDSVPSQRSPD